MSGLGGLPLDWQDVLDGPAYVINLDRRPDRLAASLGELARAGFRDVRRFPAIDGMDPMALRRAWTMLGSPKFAEWDESFRVLPGKQACFLSHVTLWQEIVKEHAPFACIFEDDLQFHKHWPQLAPAYYAFTPKDFDLLYLGSQIEVAGQGFIRRVPVHCTHAYLITCEGSRKLRSILLDEPQGVATIDSMLIALQWQEHIGQRQAPFAWYAWDGTACQDERAVAHPNRRARNSGLVFQMFEHGSDVQEDE